LRADTNSELDPPSNQNHRQIRVKSKGSPAYQTINMPHTLLLASLSLPPARQLAAVARDRQWTVHALDDAASKLQVTGPRSFYGGTDRAVEYAARFDLCLIEPPLDLLARVPPEMLLRTARFGSLSEFAATAAGGPLFVKPADPIDKCFDAGVYRTIADVRGRRSIDPDTPILVSDPVEWTSEFRCFICDGLLAAWSPYLSFGRPVWKPSSAGPAVPPSLTAFCDRLLDRMRDHLPTAFVVDVGVMEDGRWAVVEFNPAWCSGILGADARAVLKVIERAAMWRRMAPKKEQRWARLGAAR
jgi:hypothetical protein